jgi:hypothetical protein
VFEAFHRPEKPPTSSGLRTLSNFCWLVAGRNIDPDIPVAFEGDGVNEAQRGRPDND